jgi:hypothetical protein
MATLAIVAACVGGESAGPGTPDPATSPSSSADASRPVETPGGDPSPTASSGDTPTPVVASSPPGVPSDACSESDANRVFFRQAAASMAWSVYCAALGDGWFVDAGSFHPPTAAASRSPTAVRTAPGSRSSRATSATARMSRRARRATR